MSEIQTPNRDITVVLTSCNRHDLLAHTLETFLDHETEKRIARIIVAEDGDADPKQICDRFGAEYFRTGERIGQMRLIDKAYAQVTTPYIFHLEDDWEFYRSGFMERSRALLEVHHLRLLVWLRAWNDTNGMPISQWVQDRSWGVMATNFAGCWHGFTLNPGLRRLCDYKLLRSFANQKLSMHYEAKVPSAGLPYEAEAGIFYYRRGFRALILDEAGYVRHTGDGRHVSHSTDDSSSAKWV